MKHLVALLLLISFTGTAQLNGNYTVGGTTPDFQSVGEACDSIISQGIDGPVIINIRDGMYSNDHIHLSNLTGVSATNTITFQSESLDSAAVTLSHDNSEVVFLQDSTCGYINIRHLTLVQNGSSRVIRLLNGPHHCEFNTLHLYRSASGGSMFYYNNSIVNPTASDIQLVNSHFGSAPGLSSLSCIEMYANNGFIDTVLIANNIFDFPLSSGGSGFAEFTDVSNIEFKDNFVRGVFSTGIYPQFASGQNTISGNELYFYDGGVFAIDLADCNGDFEVFNNICRTGNGVFQFGTSGMSIYAVLGVVEVYNNTFYVDEVGLDIYNCDSVVSRNNLFYLNLQGGTSTNSGIYRVGNSNLESDYNAFYSNVDFAQIAGTTYNDFPSYASATGNDANSFLLFDPLFYDDSLDLHVCSDSLIGAGDPSILLSVDVDDEPRSALLPSIGADYFESLEVDFSYTQNGYDVQFTYASVWADNYLWDFGDGNTSNDQNPLHTFTSNGSYPVTLTVNNNCQTTDTTISLSITVGLNQTNSVDLMVYPNPTSGIVYWKSSVDLEQVVLFDSFGREIEKIEGVHSSQMNLSELKNGVYYLQFLSEQGIQMKKIQLLQKN